MKNILGHTKDLTLYGSCGNVMYSFIKLEHHAVETFYNTQGEIITQNLKHE